MDLTNEQYYALVVLAVADKIGTRRVIEWEKACGGKDQAQAFVIWNGRRYSRNINDVRPSVTLVAEDEMALAMGD